MAIWFRLATHTQKPGVSMVEVFDNELMIACIYPVDTAADSCTPPGIKVVSKYLNGSYREDNLMPSFVMAFDLRRKT